LALAVAAAESKNQSLTKPSTVKRSAKLRLPAVPAAGRASQPAGRSSSSIRSTSTTLRCPSYSAAIFQCLAKLTNIPAEEGGAQWPVWSPDGSRLAIQVNSRQQKNSAHIWIVDAASGEARKLAAHDQHYVDETPSWFPDGRSLPFQSNRTGRMEIWVMNTDGSGQRQVTGL